MMSQTKYETHNFNALNNAIDDEHQKSLSKIKAQKSHIFKRYMLYSSLFLISFAILILVAGFIYWLIDDKPKNLITNNEYITNNYELEKNISQLEKIIERNKEYNKNNTEQIVNNDQVTNQIIREEFYLFKTLEFKLSNNQVVDVSTGQIYDPNEIDYPKRQYCYTMLKNDGIEVRVFLSNKFGANNKINNSYNQKNADFISLDDFKKAQEFCRFRSF